jgi:iron complex transport system substrate-binding protein
MRRSPNWPKRARTRLTTIAADKFELVIPDGEQREPIRDPWVPALAALGRDDNVECGMFPPSRIVCLTEETVETLYLLGEDKRIVGVSGYAVRPPQVRREKPRVSAFISADFEKILALEPDLVLTFSDLQADIAGELIRRNVAVHAFNQRDIAGIFAMIRTLGALVGATNKAEMLARSLANRLETVREQGRKLRTSPRVFFEEWDDPIISGIKWVSELIAVAGGTEAFPEIAERKNARDRILKPEDVIAAAPDIIVGSWCGKKFVPAKVAARPGFDKIPAVRDGALHEIKSAIILQPGPAALTDGLDQLVRIVAGWAESRVSVAAR